MLWERQPNEGAKPFQAFALYRDMGNARTLAAVAKQLTKSEQLIRRWSMRDHWQERVTAYDNEVARIAQEAVFNAIPERIAAAREQIVIDELDDYQALLQEYRAAKEQARLMRREVTGFTIDPASGERVKVVTMRMTTLEFWRLTRWRLDISRMGRLTVGLPSKVTESRLTDKDGESSWADLLAAARDDDEDDNVDVDSA